MLRITRQTDYAIMLLAHIAGRGGEGLVTARDAARWSGLSIPMVSKILKSLARARLIVSHRGAGGGYSLSRTLDTTTVADVVRALEGPISIVECGAGPGLCEQETICPARVNWSRINREVEHALARVSLAEMLAPPAGPELLGVGPGAGRSR
jgi:FeS assembly SUF system regulator